MEKIEQTSYIDRGSKTLERTILVTIEKEYYSERGSHLGKLNAHFEVFPDGEIYPINTGTDFCQTEQVFLLSGYQKLKEDHGQNLFQAICIPSKSDNLKEGDCKYVTRIENCSPISQTLACHSFTVPLPNPSSPNGARIILDKLPITKSILLYDKDTECYSGPFSYDVQSSNEYGECSLTLKALQPSLSNTIPPFHVGQYDKELLETYIRELPDNSQIISNIKRVADRHVSIVDFISDGEIVSLYASKVVSSGAIRNFSKGTVSHIRKYLSTTPDYNHYPKRFERLFKSLDQVEAWKESRSDMMELFLQSDIGKNTLLNYIESNKDQYFDNERAAFQKELKENFTNENQKLAAIKAERDELISEIRRLTEEYTQYQRGDVKSTLNSDQNSYASLSKENKEKIEQETTKLESIKEDFLLVNDKLENVKSKYKKYKSLESLEKEIEFQETLKERTKSQLTETQNRLKESNDALIKKLVSLKPEVDALCGIVETRSPVEKEFDVPVIKLEGDKQDKREQIITNVIEHLEGYGRTSDFHAVSNLLTSVAQTQFTLFSGLPGTGKTSMAKLLGQSLGLRNRCLTIPVARGWTSIRDIMGFYNSLSQSYVNAPNGFMELLKQLHKEKSAKGAAAFVVLDEFNLSQPEHYFSSFMEMADSELSTRTITTGDPSYPNICIPEHLRFIGTINNDESVQSLTPRMLDRACVINFDNFDLDRSDKLIIPQINIPDYLPTAISGTEFIQLFQAETLNLTDNIRTVLSLIIDKLNEDDPRLGTPVSVSMRKIKAIAAYQNIAGPLMYEKPLGALDYAVSQHILPLLNGYSENFGRRLDELKSLIPDSMERTHTLLNRIIASGQANMHSYGMGL